MPSMRFAERLYGRLGKRYFWVFVALEAMSAAGVCLVTIGIFWLYEDMSPETFWRLIVFAEACVAAALLYGYFQARKLSEPILRWIDSGRKREGALEAWRTAVSLPREFVVENGWQPFVIVSLPIAVYFTIELDLPAYSGLIILVGATLAIAYAAVLHFFASELLLRPVVQDISRQLPPEFEALPVGVPLRWKLLGALPIINVITGVVVSGLSTDGQVSVDELGLDVVMALLVAFTISLELTVLLTKSILRPVDDLLEATRRVGSGDLDARVTVGSGDEMGALAGSFNQMMKGLSEREKLREAFGSYVDPEVAERVIEEGELLEGQDREATILFVDVRDFTAFAEDASARETVAFLNEFFDLVVPIIAEHKGHANKFLGDGVLGAFGAPERLQDHADRALSAACAIARAVDERFGDEVDIGIGLNSGPVVVGSVGGGGRLEFTVIGDPVNVAARVEAATRDTGDVILLTEATRCLLQRAEVEIEPRGEVTLKGKSEPVPVYAATGLDVRTTRDRRPLTAEA